MHIKEIIIIKDEIERDRLLRRGFSPFSEPINVDEAEYQTLIVLLNMTFKYSQNKNLCDVKLARQTLTDEKHLTHCINAIRWLHTHNLKYPDCRVSGQRLMIRSPNLIPGVISSAGLPTQMGWANNSAEFNYAKLFCSSFRNKDRITNLAEQLLVEKLPWFNALKRLGVSTVAIDILCQRLVDHCESAPIPSEVSIYSKQLRFLYQGDYIAITPVVSHALMTRLQYLIYDRRIPYTTINHDHSSSVGSLVGATGGQIAVMNYPPPVSLNKNRSFVQSRIRRLKTGVSLFDNAILNDQMLIDALHRLALRSLGPHKQRRQQRLAAMRYLRRQLAIWMGAVIELKDIIEQEDDDLSVLPVTLEVQFINQPVGRLTELTSELTSRFHLAMQNHQFAKRYAFHPELMGPVKSQINWLLKKLGQNNCETLDDQTEKNLYLHLSDLNVFDARTLANPYLCGIPSLSALAGFCHDYERRLSELMQCPISFTEMGWYISRYCPVSGRKLPAVSIPAKLRTPSALRRPGLIDNTYCELGMDIVIKLHLPEGQSIAETDLLQAALPSRFAGGCLQPLSLCKEKQWCNFYTNQDELFTVLSRLSRNGCWIYPFNSDITSLDALFDTLSSDNRLRPVSSGFIFLEELHRRPGSLEKFHTYAESTLGLSLCINPIEMRLAGKKRFYSQGFWRLNCEKQAILIKGPEHMGESYGTVHTP